MENFDLIVIGTGPAGTLAANKCAKAGWDVAIIEEREYGGTCALRGCIPKKVLVHVTEFIEGVNRLKGLGIEGDIKINWQDLMKFKKTFTDDVPEKKEQSFNKKGITTFHGTAQFISEDSVAVNDETLTGKHILIATGASPTKLPIDGVEYLTYSDQFLELDGLPNEIVFIGGGYISFEFAHIAARAGANVHIIHRNDRPLKQFEQEMVEKLIEHSEELGIKIHLSTEVQAIKEDSGRYLVSTEKDEKQSELSCDLVVHGAGRTPNIERLNLEAANVKYDKKGIEVNQYMQSISNSRVYGAGDVTATEGGALTPVAAMESYSVISNLLEGNNRTPTEEIVPSCTFTLPKLASVGLSEEEATKQGYKFKTNNYDTSKWFTYRQTNQKNTAAKILIEEGTGKILGAHLLSDEADELINHFAAAMQCNLTTSDVKKNLYVYPTSASDLGYML
ncbi:NAD(P)/FAD-dependent oxidoreductase [Bacillus tianshenii]|nr:NAD(P)/FAD-dependent oxidoreductase [Bacillus tianshenii]